MLSKLHVGWIYRWKAFSETFKWKAFNSKISAAGILSLTNSDYNLTILRIIHIVNFTSNATPTPIDWRRFLSQNNLNKSIDSIGLGNSIWAGLPTLGIEFLESKYWKRVSRATFALSFQTFYLKLSRVRSFSASFRPILSFWTNFKSEICIITSSLNGVWYLGNTIYIFNWKILNSKSKSKFC